MILLRQMVIFLFMMVLGYIIAKKGILNEEVSKSISWIIVNIANPALIISGSIGNSIRKSELLFILALAFGLYLLLILVAELIIPFFRFPKKAEGIYKILLVFTNMGFMGFPIMSAMYGSESLLYASVFMLPFNFLIYTYGIFRLIGGVEPLRVILKKCLNAGVIAVFVTFIIALWNIQLPYIITQSITMLSNLIAPLCMMVIGATFVNVSFREVFCDGKLLIFSVVRLLVIPFVFMFLLRKITDNVLLQNVAFIVIATPAGSMAAMLAQQYDADYRTASKGIALTTLLSVVTMPLMFVVLGLT